jgi:hypothetical protein
MPPATAAVTTQSGPGLARITKGKLVKPPRVLLFGTEKIGKSTFAANSPAPIFICAEDGTSELDVARFPEPKTWQEMLGYIDELTNSEHSYKTLVIDTVDWLEPLCWKEVCLKPDSKGKKHDTIEDWGYGAGYNEAVGVWRALLARLDRLRAKRGMGIVLLAHSWIKSFKNPLGDDYDRFEMKIHNKSAGLIKEWCDCVLFTTYEMLTAKKDNRAKGVADDGSRIVHTQRNVAWDAGNRYDLPQTLPLDWETFAEAVAAHQPGTPASYRARIAELIKLVDKETADKAQATTASAGENAAILARITDRLTGIIQTKEQA